MLHAYSDFSGVNLTASVTTPSADNGGGNATAGIYYYHNDHLGTPQTLTDENQTIVWQASYDPFGKATITTGTVTNNIRFPGQYFDSETGLHYNYFRYYDPSTGRYISSDPIGLAGGLNTYLFANANPINEIDPQGLSSFFFARPSVTPRPLLPRPPAPRPFPGNDPAKPPGPGWVWQGKPGSQPGGKEGNWYNPNTGESLRPDLSHLKPIGRHWDWKDYNGKWWRIFPDGSAEPKILPPVSPGNCPDKNNREWEECFASGWCT